MDGPAPAAAPDRYPLRNSTEREGTRLSMLEGLGDPVTVRWFDRIGVAAGWHCAELGAGAGSLVRWLSERVGDGGSVTAVDRDAGRLRALAGRCPNVTVVEGDLCGMDLPPGRFDLVHTRSVLMHLPCADAVVAKAVAALAPGGVVFFEETDGAPAQAVEDPPPGYGLMVRFATIWRWARGLVPLLESLGMEVVEEDVRADPLVGGTPQAEFWKFTLGSVAQLGRGADASAGGADLDREVAAMTALLDDPDFSAPFTARHRVRARRPA
ncbi:MAG: class I SAM-dependent methyltransferase [Acidobacteriota bacterium]|nr:class I SAM-dependent methyltransferase [Acidobacteriota bacterium]